MDASLKVICFSALLVTGCDSSGSGATPGGVQNDSAWTSLEGRLMFPDLNDKARIVDLSTGNVSSIPGVQAFGDPSGREYERMSSATAHAQPYSGDRFVLTVDSCKLDENDPSYFYLDDHCLALHEADGTELAVRKFDGDPNSILGGAVLSFDGDYIVAIKDFSGIFVYDSQFNLVSRFESSQRLRGVLWRPDNSLLYYSNDEIFSTAPLNAEGNSIAKFDTEEDWALGSLRVSPDGETLAYEFEDEMYLMNLSTGEVRLVPAAEHFGLGSVGVSAWSPDGQSLILYATTDVVITSAGYNFPGENFVIPVDFGLPGPDGNTVLDFTQIMARTRVWRFPGYTNENAPLDILSENSTIYWLP